MGDFNCKNVNWEDMVAGGNEESWGRKLMNFVVENMFVQWITCNTRIRCQEELSRLGLVFTTGPNDMQEARYQCPLGKSEHIVAELEKKEVEDGNRDEAYKEERYDYGRANFDASRECFGNSDWNIMRIAK